MWGPCFGHKRAIFWPFLEKGDYGIHQELWNLAWSIPGHIDYDSGRTNLKDHVRTMFWPQKGHIPCEDYVVTIKGHILAISRKKGLWDTSRFVKFGMDHPWAHWSWFRKNQFEGPGEDHLLAIKDHVLAIVRKRGLWDTPRIVKFGMEHPWAHWLWVRKSQFEGPCEDHFWAIKGSYFDHFLDYWFTEWWSV